MPGNCLLTVLGSLRGVEHLLAGDAKGVSPLVSTIREKKWGDNGYGVRGCTISPDLHTLDMDKVSESFDFPLILLNCVWYTFSGL